MVFSRGLMDWVYRMGRMGRERVALNPLFTFMARSFGHKKTMLLLPIHYGGIQGAR